MNGMDGTELDGTLYYYYSKSENNNKLLLEKKDSELSYRF